jgi:hypothetical protein
MPVFDHFRIFVKFFQYRGQYGGWFTKFVINPKTYTLNLKPNGFGDGVAVEEAHVGRTERNRQARTPC